ncbi:MAG: YhgE/Pip domain-containing protein [Candidatus Ancillula sp.]|jgi:putative membrane protein|nr:YhgE/Pip domain-containing protein [Candidatus Ancillula sp.]
MFIECLISNAKSLVRTPMLVLTVLALICVPSLYSGLYLWANQDPYGNMKNVPVALVCEDDDYGKQIADQLLDEEPFLLTVTDLQSAKDGVDVNEYSFAIFIPSDFSDSLSKLKNASNGSVDVGNGAKIELITNDANSYLVHTAASTLGNELNNIITKTVVQQIILELLNGYTQIHDNIQLAADGATELADGVDQMKGELPTLIDGVTQLDNGAKQLSTGLTQLKAAVVQMQAGTKTLSDGASQVAGGNAQVAGVVNGLQNKGQEVFNIWERQIKPDLTQAINSSALLPDVKHILEGVLRDVDANFKDLNAKANQDVALINELSRGANQVSDGAKTLNGATGQLLGGVTQLDDGAKQLSSGLDDLLNGTGALVDGVDQLQAGSSELAQKLQDGVKLIPSFKDSDASSVAKIMASPLQVTNESSVSASGYAAGLMPFFIALSSWIGAYALFVIVKPLRREDLMSSWQTEVEVEEDVARGVFKSTILPHLRHIRDIITTMFARWIPVATIGVCQMAVLLLVVWFGLGMPPAYLGITVLFLLLMTLTYSSILFTLVAGLKEVGMFFGLLLLIFQLTASGGTFPWQTTPPFFHVLHQFLPMGYAVDALRHTFYGGNLMLVWQDALVLIAYFVTFLILGLLVTALVQHFERKRFRAGE